MNDLAIIRQENLNAILQSAPTAYSENQQSRERCIQFGQSLLEKLQQGMTDELDQQAADYLVRARKTVAKMNEKRSALTKLFDDIRSRFTAMENDIDASRQGTVPYLIQQQRNQYAARKHQEELRRQQEVLHQQQVRQARERYAAECEDDLRNFFYGIVNNSVATLRNYFTHLTLENYEEHFAAIESFNCSFPEDYAHSWSPHVYKPLFPEITADECSTVRAELVKKLENSFRSEYEKVVAEERQACLDFMPSKRQELTRMAQASDEEAKRIKTEMEARDAAEAMRKEAERIQREEQQRMQAEIAKQTQQTANLFDAVAETQSDYQPKASVKKHLVAMNVEAFPEIFAFWWTHEGCRLSVEELTKMFKKQITFADKAANSKDEILLQSEHIFYEEQVKAK